MLHTFSDNQICCLQFDDKVSHKSDKTSQFIYIIVLDMPLQDVVG